MQKRRSRSPHVICHKIKYYATEISATIVFLAWIVKTLWHELGL